MDRFKLLIVLQFLLFTGFAQQPELINNHLLIVKAYNANNKADKTILYFQENDFNNLNAELNFEYGNAYYQLGEYKKAINYYIYANEQNEKLANFEIAKCYAFMNKPKFACKYLALHLKQPNKKTISEINTEEAFTNIEQTLEWKNLWTENWYSKYDLLYNEALYEKRLNNYQKSNETLLKITAKRNRAHKAFYYMSQNYLNLKMPEHALLSIKEAIKIEQKRSDYYYLQSAIYIELGKVKKAQKVIITALNLNSSELKYFIKRAEIYMQLGNSELAIQEIDNILKINSNANTIELAAKIYANNKNYPQALKYYNTCITKEPHNPDLYIQRADLYALVGTYEFAEKDYSMALDFYPTNGELYYKRGLVRAKQNNYNKACSDFKKAKKNLFMQAEEKIKAYCH